MTVVESEHPGRYNPADEQNHRRDRGRDCAATGGQGAAGWGGPMRESGQAREAEEERGDEDEGTEASPAGPFSTRSHRSLE